MGKNKKPRAARRNKRPVTSSGTGMTSPGTMTSLRTRAIFVLCLVSVSIATANVLSVPVPPNFRNPWILRLSLAFYKVYLAFHDVVEYVWDANMRFLCFKSSFVNPPSPPDVWGLDITTEDAMFDGVPVRVYRPAAHKALRPGIVFIHGGGWFIGNVDMYDPFCSSLADALDAVVISVEYRLAPDHWYPTPLNDCEAATSYFLTHAQTLGVDAERVAVVGDSAGGNLVASVILRLRDRKFSPQPRLQVLLYPALQALDMRTPSYQQNAHDPILSRHQMAGFWLLYAEGAVNHLAAMIDNNHTSPAAKRALYTSYLNHELVPRKYFPSHYEPNALDTGGDAVWEKLEHTFTDPYFSPLVAEDLSDLPRTFLMTMEHDVLRDDGFLYAQRLRDAGNDVTHVHYESGFHGLISYPIPLVEDCKIATQKLHAFLRPNL